MPEIPRRPLRSDKTTNTDPGIADAIAYGTSCLTFVKFGRPGFGLLLAEIDPFNPPQDGPELMAAHAAIEVHNSLSSVELACASVRVREAIVRRDRLIPHLPREEQPDLVLLALCDYHAALEALLLEILADEGIEGLARRAATWDLPG
jgi:hypothetical protein